MPFIVADRVKETSVSIGSGPIALGGAMTGFQSFSAKCAIGDTFYYAIQEVDSGGSPSGEWECGLGTYSAANTLTRTLVTASSTAGVAVEFMDGAKQVFITMPAAQVAWLRERLTANRTYYVSPTGSDANDGRTAESPFATIQRAVDVVANTLDAAGFAVTIQLADGTYTSGASMRLLVGAGVLTINGNSTTPENVVVAVVSSTAFLSSIEGLTLSVNHLKITVATSGAALYATSGGTIRWNNLVFGACASAHIYAISGRAICYGNYDISGGSAYHWYASNNGRIEVSSRTITITNTPAFTARFAYSAQMSSVIVPSNTFSGGATGSRYLVELQSMIYTASTTTYLPGSASGVATTATYGLYA